MFDAAQPNQKPTLEKIFPDYKIKVINFPCIAKSSSSDVVVLFHKEKSGTILYGTDQSGETTGFYVDNWLTVYDPNWTILPIKPEEFFRNILDK